MRYKIIEKNSGEVLVMRGKESTRKLYGETLRVIEWERIPDMFLCWDHALKHVQDLKEAAKMYEVKRELVIDV